MIFIFIFFNLFLFLFLSFIFFFFYLGRLKSNTLTYVGEFKNGYLEGEGYMNLESVVYYSKEWKGSTFKQAIMAIKNVNKNLNKIKNKNK